MVKLDEDIFRRVAANARLKLTDKELKHYMQEVKEVLDTFSKIDRVDTKGLEPSFQPIELKNVMREDKIQESLSVDDALKNTKHKKNDYFKGPSAV